MPMGTGNFDNFRPKDCQNSPSPLALFVVILVKMHVYISIPVITFNITNIITIISTAYIILVFVFIPFLNKFMVIDFIHLIFYEI